MKRRLFSQASCCSDTFYLRWLQHCVVDKRSLLIYVNFKCGFALIFVRGKFIEILTFFVKMHLIIEAGCAAQLAHNVIATLVEGCGLVRSDLTFL